MTTQTPPAPANEKQRRIIEYLRTQAATQTYFKSRLIGQEVGLSAKEVGTNLGAIARRGDPADLAIERWGYSSGTTWKVTPAAATDGGHSHEPIGPSGTRSA